MARRDLVGNTTGRLDEPRAGCVPITRQETSPFDVEAKPTPQVSSQGNITGKTGMEEMVTGTV